MPQARNLSKAVTPALVAQILEGPLPRGGCLFDGNEETLCIVERDGSVLIYDPYGEMSGAQSLLDLPAALLVAVADGTPEGAVLDEARQSLADYDPSMLVRLRPTVLPPRPCGRRP